jgi:CheY-like chemotaxis protein
MQPFAGPPTADPPVVLVVDDEPEIRSLVTLALQQEGYRVVGAANAFAALDIMRAVIPNLLFSDIVMPGEIDGFQLAKIAKKLHPGMKVLMTSGHDFMLRHAYENEFGGQCVGCLGSSLSIDDGSRPSGIATLVRIVSAGDHQLAG